MSTNNRTFDDAIMEAKSLLENHDETEYEALAPSAKANYQEALEFLRRLESSLNSSGAEPFDGSPDSGEKRSGSSEDESNDDGSDIEIETDLESTMGDDGNVVGPFGGDDVVVYDPNDEEGWLSMRHDATVSLDDMC